ncbi:hypothetical protein ScPMuIL_004818 [Solemya velum]
MAAAFCRLADVPTNRPASLNDLPAFEDALGVRILVVSARLGNKFLTCAETDHPERPCVYLYLVDDNHFHAITSITGFFSAHYFCTKCLKHHDHREKHRCEIKCIVCKRDHCSVTDSQMTCVDCHMTCRSEACFTHHQAIPKESHAEKKDGKSRPSPCKKWWKCTKCFKVLNRESRPVARHRCGEFYCLSCKNYVMPGHLCFLRATPPKNDHYPRYVFLDYETTQDEFAQCVEGYLPAEKPDCSTCTPETKCKTSVLEAAAEIDMITSYFCSCARFSNDSVKMERRAIVSVWQLVLVFSSCVVMYDCSKYSERVNVPPSPPVPPPVRTFRMSKLNQIWEKAQKRLAGPKLNELYADLKFHDELERNLKKSKEAGMDDEGMKEAEVRGKFLDIMKKYGLSEHLQETLPINANAEFQDQRLMSMWRNAQYAGFSDDELVKLREEFEHHEGKMLEFNALRDELTSKHGDNRVEKRPSKL